MKLNIFKRESNSAKDIEGVLRLRVNEPRLSAANVEQLRAEYLPKVAGQATVVLELDQLSFMDSAGLGFLVGLRKAMLTPQQLVLEGFSDPTLIELIKLTRMDQIFLLSDNPKQTKQLINR